MLSTCLILLAIISQYKWFCDLLMMRMRACPFGLRFPKTSNCYAFIPNLFWVVSYSWYFSRANWLPVIDVLLNFDDSGDLCFFKLWKLYSELLCMLNSDVSLSCKSIVLCASSLLLALSNNGVSWHFSDRGVSTRLGDYILRWSLSGLQTYAFIMKF